VTGDTILSIWNNGKVVSLPMTRRAGGSLEVQGREARVSSLGGLPKTAFHFPQGHPYAVLGTANAIKLFDRTTLEPRGCILLEESPSCLSDLPTGELLVGADEGGLIRVNLETRRQQRILTPKDGDAILETAVFGDIAAAFTRSRHLVFFDPASGASNTLGQVSEDSHLLLSPGDGKIYILDYRGTLQVFDPGTRIDRSYQFNVQAVSLFPLPGALGIVHETRSPTRHHLLVVSKHDLKPLWSTTVDGKITTLSGDANHVLIAITRTDAQGKTTGELRAYRVPGE
jgi:hypothetical protein